MKYSFIKNQLDKKTMVVNRPLNPMAASFDEDDDDEGADVDSRWLAKARRLQARRWRKIKHNLA